MNHPVECPLTCGRYHLNFVATMKLLLLVAMCCLSASVAQAQTVPATLNLSETVTADVVPGMRSLDLTFSVAGADTLGFALIVPVQGTTFTLLDPGGNPVLSSSDARLSFEPGSERFPPLSGGVFQLNALAAPADGNWTIRLQFPPAPTKMVVRATIFTRSRY
ncbi:hypothetical protein F2P45_14860 [Massilia sp. CCM 8733]|uniref:P/Homo B domain-containing protein n=1 Tax=Massilia mucilaginosa TaxID=2609282 RepID=A0ABX0NTZ4_9BURK|nr:hypothetical protein [Massilia mucilaginosa]NHZ90287.1 hypothetical protein [Massilia mucilaginosa]